MQNNSNSNDIVSTDSGFNIESMLDMPSDNSDNSDNSDSSDSSNNSDNSSNDNGFNSESDLNVGNGDDSSIIDSLMDLNEAMPEDDGSSSSDEEFEDTPNETKPEETVPGREYLKAKDGDKEIDIPRDVEIELKIGGKLEKLPLQEILNKASGAVNIERESSRLGRERKEFDEVLRNVDINIKRLDDATSFYELCDTIADIKGGDPDEIHNKMLEETLALVEKYSMMTSEQIQSDRERAKMARKLKEYETKESLSKEFTQKAQAKQEFHNSLEIKGISVDEFDSTMSELLEKSEKGEELGFGLDSIEDPTENDIVDYITAKKLDDVVVKAVNLIDKNLSTQHEFINRVKKAIIQEEVLNGGKKLTAEEVSTLVKRAFELDNKALSESLSKKVRPTNSENASSEEQEISEYATLEDFLNGM